MNQFDLAKNHQTPPRPGRPPKRPGVDDFVSAISKSIGEVSRNSECQLDKVDLKMIYSVACSDTIRSLPEAARPKDDFFVIAPEAYLVPRLEGDDLQWMDDLIRIYANTFATEYPANISSDNLAPQLAFPQLRMVLRSEIEKVIMSVYFTHH